MKKALLACAAATIMLSGCAGINNLLNEGTAALKGLNASTSAFYQQLQAVSLTNAPQMCTAANELDVLFKKWSSGINGGVDPSVIADEGSAIAAVNTLCAGGGSLDVGTLVSEGIGLYNVIYAAEHGTPPAAMLNLRAVPKHQWQHWHWHWHPYRADAPTSPVVHWWRWQNGKWIWTPWQH